MRLRYVDSDASTEARMGRDRAINALRAAEAARLGPPRCLDAAQYSLFRPVREAAPARKGRADPILAGPVQGLFRERW